MKKTLQIVIQEIRILGTDRQALGLLFLMPLTFIIFLSLALKDVYLSKAGRRINLRLVSSQDCSDPGSLCAEIRQQLSRYSYSITTAAKLSEQEAVELALVLPEDLNHTLETLRKGEILHPEDRVRLVFDPTLDQSLRALIESHLQLALQTVLIARAPRPAKMPAPPAMNFEGLIEERAFGGMLLPNPIEQTVPAWTLFGMFFIVIPLSNSMIRDRQLGIFKRLLSFPISRGQLIVGKILPFLMINLLQFALMFVVGIWLLPVLTGLKLNMNLSFLDLFVVTLVAALASTAYGLMVACLAKTSEQASGFGALSIVILAVLGGVMIPRVVMPPVMQNLAKISPLYWGLEAYHDIMVRHGGLQLAAGKLGVLLIFAAFCLTVSLIRFRWSEVD